MKAFRFSRSFAVLVVMLLGFGEVYSERYIQINSGSGTYHSGNIVPMGADNIVHWSGLSVTWRLHSNGAGDGLSFSQTQTAVQKAFDAWQNVSTSSIGFSYGGSTSNTWANDGQNVHYWAESGDPAHGGILGSPQTLAITCITINASKEIQDIDIVYDGRDRIWKVDGNDYDIEAVAAHENGHLIGLHHTEVTTSPFPTMYEDYQGVYFRTLENDDRVGASFLYSGTLIENETLSGTNYFDWNVTIPSNVTLTFNAGATFNFASGTSLTVNGSLVANSTDPNQRITFTGTSSTPGYWNGIKINSGSTSTASTMRRCNVSYATTGVTVTYTGNVNNVTLDKCRISNNSSKGIYVNGNGYSSAFVHPTLSSNHIFSNSSSGIWLSNYAKPFITGNQIDYNGAYGIEATSSYTGEVSFNRLANNSWQGMFFYSSSHALVNRNTVESNGSGGIYIFSNSNVTAAGGGTNQGRNEITGNTGTGVYANTSSPNFGISNGYNWMQSNTNYEAQMVGSSGYQLRAENCYWGGGAPAPSEISGNVDYSPHVTTLPNPIGWGQSDGHDPSYLVQPQPNPTIAITPPQSFYPLMASRATNGAPGDWTRDLSDAIDVGLATGDWSQASELITALHRELQDARVPVVDFDLVASYANRSDVASPIRKMLALVLVENDLAVNNTLAALTRLQNFRQSQSVHAAEFLANTGLVHLYRQNDVASAQNVLAQLRALAQNGDDIAAEHATVFARIIDDYLEHTTHASMELQRLIAARSQTHSLPTTSALVQNYPNPFNPETQIRFALPQASHVVVKIFNLLGEEVHTLVDEWREAGHHGVRWDGRDKNGNTVASGIYLYQLQAGSFSQVKKMSLVR